MKLVNTLVAFVVLGSLALGQEVVCEGGRCQVLKAVVATPFVMAHNAVHNVGERVSNAYQTALASAQYRAANRIHGHCHIDSQTTSGVGWASHDSMPTTCLGKGGEGYAVVRGVDGWYATKIATTTTTKTTTTTSIKTTTCRTRWFRR